MSSIDSMQYQGAFYFTLCALIFVFLLLVFRFYGDRLEANEAGDGEGEQTNDDWFGTEELVVSSIFEETHDIKTFRLKRKNGKSMPRFKPGQFLSFQIGDEGKTYRSYSISGSCENNNFLQVSIKHIQDGVGSGWFHSLNIGDVVLGHPPGGHFTDADLEVDERRVFVAGGIGITPFLSMLLTSFDQVRTTSPMYLFYGARTVKDLAFHDLLSVLAKRHANFHYYPVLSSAEENTWDGLTGFVSFDLIKSKIESVDIGNFFFCGPPPMTDGITNSLLENGVDKKKIHSEKFVSPTTISLDDIPHRDVTIELDGESYSYSGKQNILDFLEDKGADIPFACRSGVCGACKLKCSSGKYTALTDSGLTDDEKEEYFLSCVSWPDEDMKISE